MMNLILIEDEPPILRGLRGDIQKFKDNFIVKGAFTNAQDALSYLSPHASEIDAIITDIDLPVISGLSLIEQVGQEYPHIACIIISGYDNFEYARTALRLGATDYLSKPIDTIALHKCLLTVYENKCMESLLFAPYMEQEHIISEFTEEYILAVVCDGNYSYFNSSSQPDEYDYEYHPQNITSLLATSANMQYKTAPGKSCSETIFFLHPGQPSTGTLNQSIQNFFAPLMRQPANFTVVYSKVPAKLGDISSYLQNIRHCLYKSIIIGKNQIIFYVPGEWHEPQFLPDALRSELYYLERIFLESNLPFFKQELQHFLTLFEEGNFTQVTVFYYLTQLAYACLVNQPKERPNILIPELINDVLFYSRNYDTLYENLLSVFMEYFRDDNLNKSTTLEKIDYYIRQHYMEPLNTSQLADAFNFTPSYLSKTFREYKSISPMEYILMLKIEKAKELLQQNPSLPIKDCAALIGYNDPLYFSKVFKKVTGLSPKQFISPFTVPHK